MKPLGLGFLFLSVVIVRMGIKGRPITAVPGDLKDSATSLLTGDFGGSIDALNREGTLAESGNVPSATFTGGSLGAIPDGGSEGSKILAEAMKLGSAAKGYRWSATGPDYYDCSGLVWRAMKNVGTYTGLRFTSATFKTQLGSTVARITTPTRGTIAVWRKIGSGHVGIMTDATNVYSARSPKSGIGTSPSSVFTAIYGPPTYYAITGKG